MLPRTKKCRRGFVGIDYILCSMMINLFHALHRNNIQELTVALDLVDLLLLLLQKHALHICTFIIFPMQTVRLQV